MRVFDITVKNRKNFLSNLIVSTPDFQAWAQKIKSRRMGLETLSSSGSS